MSFNFNRLIQGFNKKITDPLGGINKLGDKWGMQDVTDLYREGPVGNASGWKQAAASKGGSILSGRAIMEGKAEARPDNHNTSRMRTIDVFGSPATAGTGAQSTARAAAAIYAAWAAAAAMGAGAAGSGTAGAGGTTASTTGGTAAGTAGGTTYGTISTGPGAGGATSASAAPSSTAGGGAASWMKWGRLANLMRQGQQRQMPRRQSGQVDPYGLDLSGLPQDMWQNPDENASQNAVIQALMQQRGMNG